MGRAHAIGVVIAVAGLLLLIIGVAFGFVGVSRATPAGQVYSFTPDAIGPTLLTVTWSGAPASSNVTLVWGPPVGSEFRYLCQSRPNYIANGSGSAGTLRAMVTGGSEYSVYVCDGIFGADASIGTSLVGVTPVIAIGLGLLVGGGLVAIAYRGR